MIMLLVLAVVVLLVWFHAPAWLLLAAAASTYAAAAVWWPFTSCPSPKCEGGRVRSPNRKNWRPCWWCGGKGSRVRLGRRLFEAITGRRKHT